MKEYKLTPEDLAELLGAIKAAMMIKVQFGMPPGPRECANLEWERLGEKYGFKWDTAEPVPGKGQEYCQAEPIEEE